jgi:hypothetical protein
MTNDKEAFFEKHKHCADDEALELIWRAKKQMRLLLILKAKR